MNKRQKWLARIKQFNDELERQQQNTSYDDNSETALDGQGPQRIAYELRTRLGWLLLGAIGILIILGIHNLSMENFVLRQQLEKYANRDAQIRKASYKESTPPKFDLYTPVPDLPDWYDQSEAVDTPPKPQGSKPI